MEPINECQSTPRREFLGALTTGVATLSIAALVNPQPALAKADPPIDGTGNSPDAWFDSMTLQPVSLPPETPSLSQNRMILSYRELAM